MNLAIPTTASDLPFFPDFSRKAACSPGFPPVEWGLTL